jgi:hypothetical protein
MKMLTAAIFLISLVPPAYADPIWATQVPRRSEHDILLPCHGEGPDRSTAYTSAIQECNSIASEMLLQNFQVSTLSLQTESHVGFHEEVSRDAQVTGLSCKIKDSYEESTSVWLLCDFDTTHSKVVDMASQVVHMPDITSENHQIVLSSVPNCDSLVIVGPNPRLVGCASNPQTLLVRPGDREVVVRANGYQPKHLDGKDLNGSLTVYLEKN